VTQNHLIRSPCCGTTPLPPPYSERFRRTCSECWRNPAYFVLRNSSLFGLNDIINSAQKQTETRSRQLTLAAGRVAAAPQRRSADRHEVATTLREVQRSLRNRASLGVIAKVGTELNFTEKRISGTVTRPSRLGPFLQINAKPCLGSEELMTTCQISWFITSYTHAQSTACHQYRFSGEMNKPYCALPFATHESR